MKSDKAIITERLTKRFGSFTAVNGLSFEVRKGEIFGFIGANGAGKTTAIKMLCGLLLPTSGNAFIAGYDIYRQSELIKKSIGYLSQKFSLYEDLSVLENIIFFGGIYGIGSNELKQKANHALRRLGLESESGKLVADMPPGWRQKIAFTTATLHDPEVVFLDEPTGGVDPVVRRQFWDLIYEASEEGMTVFVTTHYMDEAEYCNRIAVMTDGYIKELDTPANLKRQYSANSIEDVFFRIARTPTEGEAQI